MVLRVTTDCIILSGHAPSIYRGTIADFVSDQSTVFGYSNYTGDSSGDLCIKCLSPLEDACFCVCVRGVGGGKLINFSKYCLIV